MVRQDKDKYISVCDVCGAELMPVPTRMLAVDITADSYWIMRYKLPGGWWFKCRKCWSEEIELEK